MPEADSGPWVLCLGPWEVEMPYGGQSPFPVQVALLGQVSWEIGTSCFR